MRNTTTLACAGALFATSLCGQIDPAFARKLREVAKDTKVPVYIVMAEQLDVAALDRRLETGQATRAMRHYMVCKAARDVAARTQPAVMARIRPLLGKDRAANPQGFWIENAIALDATPDSVRTISGAPGIWRITDGEIGVELIAPVATEPTNEIQGAGPEPGLLAIKADFLWNLGFLGADRIGANIDTGVDGNHPAFSARWRGNLLGVKPQHAWHSPVQKTLGPVDTHGHGTHTIGTICGDDGLGNRIGVAPQALWIASDAIRTTSIINVKRWGIEAFQWCADPDSDIRTIEDVPDAVGNSWGLSPLASSHQVGHCDATYHQAIDVCEAAGCAVVFAAGNEGSRGARSLRTPGDRSSTPYNVFAVGALNPGSATIASFSSRGPSGCANAAIKPEVCARGVSVRSAYRNNTYRSLSGTSMACPHVTGAAVLLREVEPNLSSNELKEILFKTADDLGATGEDNAYGNGRINLEKAYKEVLKRRTTLTAGIVTTTPSVKVGTALSYFINLKNHSKQNVAARIEVSLRVVDLKAEGPIFGPLTGVVPASLDLDPKWLQLEVKIPTGLPAPFFGYSYELIYRLRDSGNKLIDEARTSFKITR